MEFLDTINQQKDIYDKSKCMDCIFKNVRTPVVGIPFTENESKSKRESSSGIPAFNWKSARTCADKWLDKELVEAVAAGASLIICLGKEVETTIKE